MTVIYIDSVFCLNGITDYFLLLVTAKLAGIPLRRRRYCIAAVVGGGETPSVCLMGEAGAVAQWGAALKSQLNARGGGKPGIFQGTVSATAEQLEIFFGDWYVCNKMQP